MSMLEIRDLHVEFTTRGGVVHAVNGVSLTVDRGRILGLVGESGSGKTVTSMAALGLVPAPGRISAGSIRLDGQELLGLPPAQVRALRGSRLSFVPQSPRGALNALLRVGVQMENILASHPDVAPPRRDRRQHCLQTIADVGIPDPERVYRAYPGELSGGMAQRVLIANSLLLQPELVIADEPTTGLDVTVQAQILDLFSDRVAATGAGAVLVTHDLGVVANYCTDVAVMYAGRIVEAGTVEEIFRNPLHPYTRGLLASVPVPGRPLFSLPGTAPDLRLLPSGCSFADRCPVAFDRCHQTPPERHPGGAQRYLCHLEDGTAA